MFGDGEAVRGFVIPDVTLPYLDSLTQFQSTTSVPPLGAIIHPGQARPAVSKLIASIVRWLYGAVPRWLLGEGREPAWWLDLVSYYVIERRGDQCNLHELGSELGEIHADTRTMKSHTAMLLVRHNNVRFSPG